MKNTSGSYAIYQNRRSGQARLIAPNETVSKGFEFVISHGDQTVIAHAYGYSTNGSLQGGRTIGENHRRNYLEYVEGVMSRAINSLSTMKDTVERTGKLSTEELSALRHCLGGSHTESPLGWRNYYAAGGDDVKLCEGLVEKKLMEKGRDDMFRATRDGAFLAGVNIIQIEEMFKGVR